MNRSERQPSWRRLLLALAPVLLAWLPAQNLPAQNLPAQNLPAQNNEPKPGLPFLWRIEGAVPSYLFGTIHLPDERVTTLHPAVDQAIEDCDALYTELPMDLKTMAAAIRLSALPRGQQLRDVVPRELYERLSRFLEDRGQSVGPFGRFKPWVIATQVPLFDHLKELAGGQPLDAQLYERARRDDKEVGGLETVEEQTGVFDGLSAADQAVLLREALDQAERHEKDGRNFYEELVAAYLSGSGAALEEITDADESEDQELADRLEKALLTDRNLRIAERMAHHLRDQPDTSFFFAVGAAHSLGEFGLARLLRTQGFELTRVPVTPASIDEEVRELEAEIERLRERIESLRARGKTLRKAG